LLIPSTTTYILVALTHYVTCFGMQQAVSRLCTIKKKGKNITAAVERH